ncbi:hypothetical protein DVA76_19070, partial [Acinetobacter baumannii]
DTAAKAAAKQILTAQCVSVPDSPVTSTTDSQEFETRATQGGKGHLEKSRLFDKSWHGPDGKPC